jgi:hypothetical protein
VAARALFDPGLERASGIVDRKDRPLLLGVGQPASLHVAAHTANLDVLHPQVEYTFRFAL